MMGTPVVEPVETSRTIAFRIKQTTDGEITTNELRVTRDEGITTIQLDRAARGRTNRNEIVLNEEARRKLAQLLA